MPQVTVNLIPLTDVTKVGDASDDDDEKKETHNQNQ